MSSFMQDTRDPEEDLGLLELLGEGSYGAVYRAERRTDNAEVAVKIIPADNPADLLKEVDIMMACQSPYIVRLHDCYYKDNEAWLVMDFVGGGSVCDILEACHVTLSEAEARECTAWTVLALDYLHSNRKLHRDVKAGNILLTLDGRAKLADFGVSKEVNTMANKAQTAIGTPYWMAPEVIQEVPYDGQADIWSLAITCVEMVEGNPPLHKVHPMRAIFMIPSKPSPKLSEPAKWSLEFNDFIARCLEKKPEDRPSARNLLRHPWIAASVEAIEAKAGEVGSGVIRDLVAEHLSVLTNFREEASDAKANMVAEEREDRGNKTATLRRMSSTRGGESFRGGISQDVRQIGGSATEAGTGTRMPGRQDNDDDGECSSNGSVLRVPVSDEDGDDGYSSSGSVLRVSEGTGWDEDGYSSGGSVVRVPAVVANDEKCQSCGESLKRITTHIEGQGDGDSDDSVVRVPVREECSSNNFGKRTESEDALSRKLAFGAESDVLHGGKGIGDEPTAGVESEDTGQKHGNMMAMNLQAAAKYFGTNSGLGGVSRNPDAGGSSAPGERSNGSAHAVPQARDSLQAKALIQELERLDVSFAQDLASLRLAYDAKKAALDADLKACLNSQRA